MKHRTALASVLAAASLLGTAGLAQASHGHENTNYSPCRPDDSTETRIGYHDDADANSVNHQLPTIYAKGDQTSGYIGICSGNSHGDPGQPPAQFVQVGSDAPYVTHSEPEAPTVPAATGTPADDEGTVNVGADYVEVDGTEGNTASKTVDPRLDGYVSAGLSEDHGQPGVCASGANNHAYYETQPQQKDCNQAVLKAAGVPVPE